jgi:hypothetical protein
MSFSACPRAKSMRELGQNKIFKMLLTTSELAIQEMSQTPGPSNTFEYYL